MDDYLSENSIVYSYTIVRGNLTLLDFIFKDAMYTAKISTDKISIQQKNNDSNVAELYLKTGKSLWYIDHCCGAQGFGTGLDDVCMACQTPDGKLEATTENKGTIIINGKYSKEMEEILTNKIIAYKNRLENKN
jgi:hypothetical protein